MTINKRGFLKEIIQDQKNFLSKLKLLKSLPLLINYEETAKKYNKTIMESYFNYIEEFSTSGMAISYQTAVFLLVLCDQKRPTRILDLGSGYSSYLVRFYAKRFNLENAEIFSVDDNEGWLKKTKEFINIYQQPTYNLLTWDDFSNNHQDKKFDVVFHDLGNIPTRQATLPHIVKHNLAQDGHLILDDLQVNTYKQNALKVLSSHDIKFHDVTSFTLDHIGRFSGLGIKK